MFRNVANKMTVSSADERRPAVVGALISLSLAGCGIQETLNPETLANIPCHPSQETEIMLATVEYAEENALTTMHMTGSNPNHFSSTVLVRVDAIRISRTNNRSMLVIFQPHFADVNPPGHDDEVERVKQDVEALVRTVCANGPHPQNP